MINNKEIPVLVEKFWIPSFKCLYCHSRIKRKAMIEDVNNILIKLRGFKNLGSLFKQYKNSLLIGGLKNKYSKYKLTLVEDTAFIIRLNEIELVPFSFRIKPDITMSLFFG